jgi:hypothetical protein
VPGQLVLSVLYLLLSGQQAGAASAILQVGQCVANPIAGEQQGPETALATAWHGMFCTDEQKHLAQRHAARWRWSWALNPGPPATEAVEEAMKLSALPWPSWCSACHSLDPSSCHPLLSAQPGHSVCSFLCPWQPRVTFGGIVASPGLKLLIYGMASDFLQARSGATPDSLLGLILGAVMGLPGLS